MTAIRFQADADLRQAIVTETIRRQPSLNFQSANEARLKGIKDPEVFGNCSAGWLSVGHSRSQDHAN
jgi:hypothetical protein